MKIYISIKLLIILFLLIPSALAAQAEMVQTQNPEVPNFQFETITAASPDKELTNLDIYLKIAYDELQFIKYTDMFQATYELSIIIFDASGDRQEGRVTRDTIRVEDFVQTNSREDFAIIKSSFLIKHDSYRINIGVMDLDTRKTGFRRLTLSVPKYGKRLAVSDILLLDFVEISDSGDFVLTPNVSNAFISESSEFKAYYEIYGVKKKLSIRNSVTDLEGKEIYSEIFSAKPVDGVIKTFVPIKKDELKFNRYKFVVEVGKGKKKVTKSKTFRVRWFGMSETITDLDKAVEYLRYIASEKELKKMLFADNEFKRQLFINFWKKRDPSPESGANELMVEYYKRVRYTNENFSSFQDGWKADMGMVYILFGNPNDIERHPFEIAQKPYEVWYYYELNRNFVFQDYNGFGDYKLVSPLYDISRSDF